MNKLFCILLIFTLFSCQKGKSGNSETTVVIVAKVENVVVIPKVENNQYNTNSLNSIYFEEIETPNIDFSLIKVSNCVVTTEYSFPDIDILHIGLGFNLPYSAVTRSYISEAELGDLRIILQTDIDIEKSITLIARNAGSEYVYPREISICNINDEISQNEFLGYYFDFIFENKPWFNNNNIWNIIVKSGDEEIINDNITSKFTYLLFKELDSSPFVRNGLSKLRFNDEYTYRFNTRDADIIVIYLCLTDNLSYTIYRPVLYLLPNKSNDRYTDIKISWADGIGGQYYIKGYKSSEFPTRITETIITDYFYVGW